MALAIEALGALAQGPFINDWELPALTSFTRPELAEIYRRTRAEGYASDDQAKRAIGSSLSNLVYFPHKQHAELERMLGRSRAELGELNDKSHERYFGVPRKKPR